MFIEYDTYQRCPPNVPGYDYYCYAIFAQEVPGASVSLACSSYGGLPVWFSDMTELLWMKTVLEAHSIDCIYIGKFPAFAISTYM